jgi:hypothetical protein
MARITARFRAVSHRKRPHMAKLRLKIRLSVTIDLGSLQSWPGIIFKSNKQIRQMLHTRKSSTNSAYSLYTSDADEVNNIYINVQVNLVA